MIIWNGAGIMVLIVAVIFWAIGLAVGGDKHGMLGGGIGLLISSVALWYLGRNMNNPINDRVLIDPKTGQQVVVAERHSLMFIPVEWWSIIVALGAFVLIVNTLLNGEGRP
jgi:hypothetical protein